MAAKSKKRLLKTENKLLEFDKIELRDVICSICQSIFLEPVTLPCFHNFCQSCFKSSIENNALCCPLCRLRIGSWLRTTTKQNKLVNINLWDFIKSKFSNEVETKLQGEDIKLSQEQKTVSLSEPGEIRAEYEAELKRLQAERLREEQKQLQETTLLIKKIQKEDDETQKKNLDIVKQDEMLAKQVQEEHEKRPSPRPAPRKEVSAPRKEVSAPRKEVSAPRKEVPAPRKEVPAPSKVVAAPSKEVPAPRKEVPAPSKVVPAPSKEGPAPSKEGPAPRKEGPVPRKERPARPRPKPTLVPIRPRLKTTKMDDFLTKESRNYKSNPMLIDDSTNSSYGSDSVVSERNEARGSPEMIPSYTKFLKNMLDKRMRFTGFWNKENGDNCKTKKTDSLPQPINKYPTHERDSETPNAGQSLPVSLPYTGILQHKINSLDKQSVGGGSVDSMTQELCYFKPVQGKTQTSYNAKKGLPLRVPVIRLEKPEALVLKESPTRMQYVHGLCVLRNRSLKLNLPSAFAIALKVLKKNTSESNKAKQCVSSTNPPTSTVTSSNAVAESKDSTQVDGINKLNTEITLRRTRSMGSITKSNNETTPKKARTKGRQVASERKPYLRSESKKNKAKKELNSPPINSDSVNNNKVNLAVKNLSSPLQHCDVEKIFEEQLRIMKQMEQEKSDLELARKVNEELNGRRPRRPPAKRRAPPAYALRPAKKLKV